MGSPFDVLLAPDAALTGWAAVVLVVGLAFVSLAAGMGAGVGMFVETALGVTLIGALMVAARGQRIGMHPKGETVVKLTVSARDGGPDPYPHRAFDAHLRHARLLSTRSGPDGDRSSSPTSSNRSARRTCPPSRAP